MNFISFPGKKYGQQASRQASANQSNLFSHAAKLSIVAFGLFLKKASFCLVNAYFQDSPDFSYAFPKMEMEGQFRGKGSIHNVRRWTASGDYTLGH
jgi:hypothetical protein